MQRRNFLTGVTAGSVLAAASGRLNARFVDPAHGPARFSVLCQIELPGAESLANEIDLALRKAGLPAAPVVRFKSQELAAIAAIDAQLVRSLPGGLVGIMDDASSVVFNAVAAARGAGYRFQAQHCVYDLQVRHQLRRSGMQGALEWSEARGGWQEHIARLYADLLARRSPAPLRVSRVQPGASAAPQARIVSFSMTT